MRSYVAGILVVLAVSFSGCMINERETGKTVEAKDNEFVPNSLSVKQNDRVTFRNIGQTLHSVQIHKAGEPVTTLKKDDDLPKGTSTEYTFQETGTFHVYCKYHSGGSAGTFNTGMVTTVTVA